MTTRILLLTVLVSSASLFACTGEDGNVPAADEAQIDEEALQSGSSGDRNAFDAPSHIVSGSCTVEHDGWLYKAVAGIDLKNPDKRMYVKFVGMPGRTQNNISIKVDFPGKSYADVTLESDDDIVSRAGEAGQPNPLAKAVAIHPHKGDVPPPFHITGTHYDVSAIFDFPGDDHTCHIHLKY